MAGNNDCFLGLTPYTLIAAADGTQVATSFPNLVRMATFRLNRNLGILGMQFSSTLTNVSATDLMGLFVFIGSIALTNVIALTPTESANQALWLSHITNTNAVPGFASPASRVSTVGFGESGIHLPAGQPVSIYGCAGNDASNLLTGILNLYTIDAT